MRYMTLAFSMVFAASMAWAQGLGPINGGPMNGPITVPKPCGGGQCGGPPVQPQRNPQTQPQPQAQPQNQNLPQPNQGDLPDSAYGPTVPVSPQMVEWNRMAGACRTDGEGRRLDVLRLCGVAASNVFDGTGGIKECSVEGLQCKHYAKLQLFSGEHSLSGGQGIASDAYRNSTCRCAWRTATCD